MLPAVWRTAITEIIHCAADIRFGISLEDARAANVERTRQMLDLARQFPRLDKFAHISSVYAVGKLSGDSPEQPFPPSAALPVRWLVDTTFKYFEMRPPRLVSMPDFEGFAASRGEMLRVLDQFLPHLALYQSFQNDATMADLPSAGLPVPRIESYYSRVIDYCVRSKWGRRSGLAGANGSIGAPETDGRDSDPIAHLQGGPMSDGAPQTSAFKSPR